MKLLINYFSVLMFTLYADGLITPIPLNIEVDQKKAALGKELFFDPILSKDNSVACVNCHQLSNGGADATPVSYGVEGKEGNINSPTVFNSVFNLSQFWDGRAQTLQEQAGGPILNPVEMASTQEQVLEKLQKDSHYTQKFAQLYPDRITFTNILEVLAEYEKTLITPNSRFDQFLRGDTTALTEDEKEGYRLFKQLGCISCHNGINIGSNMFQKFGIFVDDKVLGHELGRYNVTKDPSDKYYFKVPSLRNIEKTAPYFHDGRAQTLQEAVAIMGKYQLGEDLNKETIEKLTKFLKTLTGEYRE